MQDVYQLQNDGNLISSKLGNEEGQILHRRSTKNKKVCLNAEPQKIMVNNRIKFQQMVNSKSSNVLSTMRASDENSNFAELVDHAIVPKTKRIPLLQSFSQNRTVSSELQS